MKQYVKRILVFLLTLSLFAGFCVPAVFATDEGADTADALTTVYNFGDYANNGALLTDCAASIWTSYGANTLNWRYEAASTTYQFRCQDKHPDVTGTGQNKIIADSLQFFGAENWWYAVRLRSPGPGKYSLTLENTLAYADKQFAIYFFDADDIDEALGADAFAYSKTVSDDPYLVGGTEVFDKYYNVINTMVDGSEPAMVTDLKNSNLTTGEFSIGKSEAFVMVIQYISEGNAKLQLKSLTATKIGEVEIVEEDNGDNTLWYAVAAAAVVCGAVVIVAVTRKKKKAE